MRNQSAYTLMESLITLAIAAILLTISLPALNDYYQHNKAFILQLQLSRAIELARQEARAKHAPVVLCQSKSSLSCDGNWADGQLIFINENEDGLLQNKQQVLAVLQTKSPRGNIHWRSYPFYRDYLLFLPDGFTNADNGTFWYCEEQGRKPDWAIMLNKAGRMRVVNPDKNGVIKDGRGELLSCND